MIRLPCYEPAGAVLELSGDDLTRHVIGFGSTGAGKTTGLINPLLQQLIAWKASDQNLRVGLLVLDPKADDSSAKISEYARAAGRERDLLILSADSDTCYDLLGGLERLDQIEAYTQRLLSGTRDMGQDNHYWTETRNGLVETALVLLLANGAPVRFSDAASFMQA
jgi:type IV secretory pathway TraG/TraD family ATPase VirD4